MVAARVRQIQAVFERIAATRMAGLPVCHPGLRVAAVGFEPLPDEPGVLLGVLVTPWFMNLVRLPLDPARPPQLAERASAIRAIGPHRFAFIGAFEPELGGYESCSLFSPMHEFADQAAAEATAREVLVLLRAAVRYPAATDGDPTVSAARRGFLLGRARTGAAV